jgi:predicted transcriptional regulator
MGRADTGAGSDATHNNRYMLVKSLVQQGKLSPSVQELTAVLSMSRATAQRYLVALQEEGVVERAGTGYLPRGCQRRVPWLDSKCRTDIRTLDEDPAMMRTSDRTSVEPGAGRTDPRYEEAKHLVLRGEVPARYRELKIALRVGQLTVQRYLRAMLDEGVLVRRGRRWTVRTHQVLAAGTP